jgi:hypothetical protein
MPDTDAEMRLLFVDSKFFSAIGVISFAFVCHHACFIVFNSLRDNTEERWAKTVHLTLPEECAGEFEAVLDYMYRFHRDPRAEHALRDLSAESAVGALWLAGRLEMTGLQQQVVVGYTSLYVRDSAPVYLGEFDQRHRWAINVECQYQSSLAP